MPSHRGKYGAGTVTRRAPGIWQLRISLGTDPLTGKHRRLTKTVRASTEKEANRELASFVSAQQSAKDASSLGGLVGEYLNNCHDMSPTGRAENEGMIARYLPAHLAAKKVREIGAHDLDRLYGHLRKEGGVCRLRGDDKCTSKPCQHGGGGPLSPSTVDRLHTLLHAALEQGVRWDYLPANPASKCRRITLEQREVQLPPAEHLVKLLAALADLKMDSHESKDGSPLPDFVALLLATGARPGELCALTWARVDLSREGPDGHRYGVVTIASSVARSRGGAVVKNTKTNKVRRVTIAGPVVEALDRRLLRWREAALKAGVPLDELAVFPSKQRAMKPLRPDSISKDFRSLRDSLDLSDDLTLRNLRHHGVSVLAAAGIDVVTVAKRMGHSPAIMMGVYAHLFEKADLGAAQVQGSQFA